MVEEHERIITNQYDIQYGWHSGEQIIHFGNIDQAQLSNAPHNHASIEHTNQIKKMNQTLKDHDTTVKQTATEVGMIGGEQQTTSPHAEGTQGRTQ